MKYYIEHAQDFISDTLSVDMSEVYSPFISKLENNATILDIGCGSGRDLLVFKNAGFRPTGLEPSKPLAQHAKNYADVEVWEYTLQDLVCSKKFDAIWACASLLHIPSSELAASFTKIAGMLVDGGILYASFKHGDFEGERNGRFFNFQTLKMIEQFIPDNLHIEQSWVSEDRRQTRSDDWLNLIFSKR